MLLAGSSGRFSRTSIKSFVHLSGTGCFGGATLDFGIFLANAVKKFQRVCGRLVAGEGEQGFGSRPE